LQCGRRRGVVIVCARAVGGGAGQGAVGDQGGSAETEGSTSQYTESGTMGVRKHETRKGA
jgi:hypothetical protein